MTDVAQIVACLTKAQRAALLWGPGDCEWWGEGNLGRFKLSLAAMDRGDLGKPELTECRFSLGRIHDARLTPLGLAVRTALLSKEGESADA